MDEQPETTNTPEEPQVPRAICPLQTCDWSIPYPPSGDVEELKPQLEEHTRSHDPHEFMYTISLLQQALWEAHSEINDLHAALRGANHIMQAAGIVPKSPFEQATDELIAPASGLLLPERVARELQGEQDAQRTQQHHVGTTKHGDVVPGKGTLVGKRIKDPMVLRDLKKGQQDREK